MIDMQTNDRQITDLMRTIHSGATQLPDFQRGWVWDDNRIRALIASITCNFPVGAAMFLEYPDAYDPHTRHCSTVANTVM